MTSFAFFFLAALFLVLHVVVSVSETFMGPWEQSWQWKGTGFEWGKLQSGSAPWANHFHRK